MDSDEQLIPELIAIQPQLYGFVLALVGNRDDADELLQQTNLVILRKQDDFEVGTNFGAWARKVAYFEVRTFRKTVARNRVRLSNAVVEQLAEMADSLAREPGSLRLALRHCLDKLNSRRRRLIEDRYSF